MWPIILMLNIKLWYEWFLLFCNIYLYIPENWISILKGSLTIFNFTIFWAINPESDRVTNWKLKVLFSCSDQTDELVSLFCHKSDMLLSILFLNRPEFSFYCWFFVWHRSLSRGHSFPAFLFTTLHPRWHLGVSTTTAVGLNPASGDKQRVPPPSVLAAETVQRSAGRKGSAAGRCECYHRRAETSR